jgi:hypothetical protein
MGNDGYSSSTKREWSGMFNTFAFDGGISRTGARKPINDAANSVCPLRQRQQFRRFLGNEVQEGRSVESFVFFFSFSFVKKIL